MVERGFIDYQQRIISKVIRAELLGDTLTPDGVSQSLAQPLDWSADSAGTFVEIFHWTPP